MIYLSALTAVLLTKNDWVDCTLSTKVDYKSLYGKVIVKPMRIMYVALLEDEE
jgi:hypothetical protein